jgi:hypothetical protein
MEYLYWALGALWIIGAICQIAKTAKKIYVNSIDEPYAGAFLFMNVMLFFTWPYWYFYDRG